jgi:hypothetical protein
MDLIPFVKCQWIFNQLAESYPDEVPLSHRRMTLNSLIRGITFLYNGRSNDLMATMLYNFFSRGVKNYEIKFSSFVRRFIIPLEGDDESQRKLAFSLLDDD